MSSDPKGKCDQCSGRGRLSVFTEQGQALEIACPTCKGQPKVHPVFERGISKFEEVFDGIFGSHHSEDSDDDDE